MRRQDIAPLVFYGLGYSRVRNLVFRLQRKPVTRFLALHDVLPEALNSFKTNMAFLKRRTNVIDMDDFFAGRLSTARINVVITFDDGYLGWLSQAIPILKEYGLKATFFIASGLVGLSTGEAHRYMQANLFRTMGARKSSGGLSAEDVRKIADEGFLIGGHTLNHIDLGKTGSLSLVKFEVSDDKRRLQEIAGKRVDYFAYPSGGYQNPVIDLTAVLEQSGYRGAVTVCSGFNTQATNPFLLHRDLTDASMPLPAFRARVYGNGDPVGFLKKLIYGVRRS